jgi:hypothetical protein
LAWVWARVAADKSAMNAARNGSLRNCIIDIRRFTVGGSIKHGGVGLESCWEKIVRLDK